MATMVFAGMDAGLEVPEPGKMLLNGRFPCYGLYRTKDGGYMSLGALEPKFWINFCGVVDREDLIGRQFGGPEVTAEVERIFASRTREEWTNIMRTVDACCEPILSLQEACDSDLTAARGMVTHEAAGARFLGSPLRLSGSPALPDETAPSLGQHTDEILSQLGLSADEVQSLRSQDVIA